MPKQKTFSGLCAAAFLIATAAAVSASAAHADAVPALHIDVPVTLQHGNVVFDVGHDVVSGDTPFLIGDINLLVDDYAAWKTDGKIVMVFHGDAAFVLLDDATYNQVRHVTTGNPYAKVLADWMQHGAQVELCGATAMSNHWTNANLVAGVKVDTNAMVRVTQLEQQGYTLIYE